MHRDTQRLHECAFLNRDVRWQNETKVFREGIVGRQSATIWWRRRKLHECAKIVSATSAIVACPAWHTRLKGYAVSSLKSRYPRANIDNLASGLVAENEWLTDYELSDLAMLPVVNLVVEEAVSSRKANLGVEDSFIHLNRRVPSQSL